MRRALIAGAPLRILMPNINPSFANDLKPHKVLFPGIRNAHFVEVVVAIGCYNYGIVGIILTSAPTASFCLLKDTAKPPLDSKVDTFFNVIGLKA